MKKHLLLTLAAVSTLAAFAQDGYVEPEIFPNTSFQYISPNGNWTVSEVYGEVQIVDIVSGTIYTYSQDETGLMSYSLGLGNCVSNDGTVLGSTTSQLDAAYWQNEEWFQLDTEGSTGMNNLANGITPDGSRICGSVNLAPISLDATSLMLVPVYWDRNEDGTYGKLNVLPHPSTDLSGRCPQYITANYISADGKTIGGLVTDFQGFIQQPIVYTQDEKGEWSYKLLIADQFNPDGIVIPEWPGEWPEQPQPQDFFSAEDKAAYDAAYAKYLETYDWSLYPSAIDYLTGDSLAAYNAAMAEYQAVLDEWQPKNDAFEEAMSAILEVCPQFEFNHLYLTPDGKKYVTDCYMTVEDPNSWFGYSTVSSPWIIDIETDQVTTFEHEGSIAVCGVPNNDVVFATNGLGAVQPRGFIIENGEIKPIEDWLSAKSPELKEWIESYMVQTVATGWDEETYEEIYEDLLCTGLPQGSEDLKVVTIWSDCPWDYMSYAEGYLFRLDGLTGVKDTIVAGKNRITFDADGNIVVEGNVNAVTVYDLQGREVFASAIDGSAVKTNLPSGIYVIRANTANGGAFSAKISK